jgi:hypothetical protein
LATTTPWPSVEFGGLRLWDAGVAWPNLEPRKGEWHFDNLDLYVEQALKHNVEILMPLGLSPTWASSRPGEKSGYAPGNAAEPMNMEDWRNYVRTVATRYKGRIHYYEIWNEPNLKIFYTGDVQHLVDLTREASKVLKEVSPDNRVVSPSATNGLGGVAWLDDFLAKGGGQYVDVIGFHLYTNSPEEMLPIISGARAAMARHGAGNKQLWDTEAGWKIVNRGAASDLNPVPGRVLSNDAASAFIARAYVLQWAAGVSRHFLYAWDNSAMGLVEADGKTVKPPAAAYAEIQRWLVGSVMDSCRSDNNGTWAAHIVRPDRSGAWIVWHVNGKARWTPPGRSGHDSIMNVAGKRGENLGDITEKRLEALDGSGRRGEFVVDLAGKRTPTSRDGSIDVDDTPRLLLSEH